MRRQLDDTHLPITSRLRRFPASFARQSGDGALTVCISQVDVVRRYIRNQAEHHTKQSVADEFRPILSKHKIA